MSNLSCIGWFSDLISGIVDIKLWNLHDAKTSEYEKQIDHINEASKNASLFSAKNNRIMQMTGLRKDTDTSLNSILEIMDSGKREDV